MKESFAEKQIMRGTEIVSDVICPGLITMKNGGPAFDGEKHRLSGVEFSPLIRDNEVIRRHLPEIAVEYLALCEAVEEDSRLRVEPEQIDGGLKARIGAGPLTGLMLLWLMEQGILKLAAGGEQHYTAVYAKEFAASLREPELLLSALFEDLLLFSGDEPSSFRLDIESEGGFRTTQSEDGLSVTSAYDDELELLILQEIAAQKKAAEETHTGTGQRHPNGQNTAGDTGDPAHGIRPEDVALSPRETCFSPEDPLPIAKDVEESLIRLSRAISDIDRGSDEVMSIEDKYHPSYTDGHRVSGELLEAEIPDGYRAVCDTEGRALILWLPNRDNPEEWEASVLQVISEKYDPEAPCPEGVQMTSAIEGGSIRFSAEVPVGRGVCTFRVSVIGVEEGREADARKAAAEILGHIRGK